MNEEKSEFWTDTWPGRFLLNSVGYILVFFPILIGLFVTKKILKLDPTILTEKTWEQFHTVLTKKSVPIIEQVFYNKLGCILPMVICSQLCTVQQRHDDHPEDASHFGYEPLH